MPRLRQYYANRYSSAEATSSEFESIVRYLNAAELGNLTVAELLQKIFDNEGRVTLGIQFRFTAGVGLEAKMDPDSSEWTLLAADEDLRGAPGESIGTIEAPLFFNKQVATGTGAQTVFPYSINAAAVGLMVWVNGILQPESAYSYTAPGASVTFVAAPPNAATITFASVRTPSSVTYSRADYSAASNQAVFPFTFTEDDEIIVFRNGIFQREGGGYDYVKTPSAGTITMTTPQTAGTVITIMNVANRNIREVGGLMLEERFTDEAGFIRYDRVAIADNQIERAKVNGLPAILSSKANITIGASAPAEPASRDLWINTSGSVPALYFNDGTRWISGSAAGLIPLPETADALKFLRLNSTGTALEYAGFDASNFVAKSAVGNPSGVAPLDAAGLLPSTVLPAFLSKDIIPGRLAGAVANGTYTIGIISGGIRVVNGLSAVLASGTATVQLSIGGVNVGDVLAASNTVNRLGITNSIVNASSAPKLVQVVISGASSPVDLVVSVECLVTG